MQENNDLLMSIKDLPNEVWKDIKGYEGRYKASNLGRIKSLKFYSGANKKWYCREKIMKQPLSKCGYCTVGFYNGEKHRVFRVNRIIAETFILNPYNLPFVNHKDENPRNNNVDNLEWCTAKYNCNYGNRNKKIGIAHRKKVNQYDLNDNFIKQWDYIYQIEKELCIHFPNVIACCRGKRKTAGGYKWRYADERE